MVAAALFCLGLLVTLPGLGAKDVIGDDESIDAAVAKSIATGGPVLVPRFNGNEFAPKPPLFYWLSALSCVVLGRADAFAVRLPSALAAAAGLSIVFLWGARSLGATRGLWAALFLASFPLYADQARIGRTDMLMSVLLLAGWALLSFAHESADPARFRRLARVSALLFGLAILTKGSAAAGLAVLGILGFAAARRSKRPLQILRDPLALALLVGPAAAWYVAASIAGGSPFILGNVLGENFRLLLGNRLDAVLKKANLLRTPLHPHPLSYHLGYVPIHLFSRTLPWCALVPFAFLCLRRKKYRELTDAIDARLDPAWLAWIATGWLLLTIASRKSPYYVLPLVPALALQLAAFLPARREAEEPAPSELVANRTFLFSLAAILLILSIVAGAALLLPWPSGRRAALLILGKVRTDPWVAAPVLVLMAGAAAAAIVSLSERATGPLLACVALVLFSYHALLHPWLAPIENGTDSLRPFSTALDGTLDGRKVAFFRATINSIVYHHGAPIPVVSTKAEIDSLAKTDRALLVIARGRDKEELVSEAGGTALEILSGRGRTDGKAVGPVHLMCVGAEEACRAPGIIPAEETRSAPSPTTRPGEETPAEQGPLDRPSASE